MVKLKSLFLISACAASSSAHGYVFSRDSDYTGNPVRLNVTPENPKAYFFISGTAPEFKNKEKFLDGKYAGYSDSEFFKAMVMEAMQRWNDVEDSYVELVLAAEAGPGTNPDDKKNNITFASTSWSEAGGALAVNGTTEQDAQFIIDCDISLSSETDTERLASTVLHELGHCIGLKHPHYSTKAVMSYATKSTFSLYLDDKAGATVLYPLSYEKRKNLIPLCGDVSSGSGSGSRSKNIFGLLLLFIPGFLVFAKRQRAA